MRWARRQGRIPADSTEEGLAVVIRALIITMGLPIGTACLLFSTALVQCFVMFSRLQSRIKSSESVPFIRS